MSNYSLVCPYVCVHEQDTLLLQHLVSTRAMHTLAYTCFGGAHVCIYAMHGWRKIIQKQANKSQAHCSVELGGGGGGGGGTHK